MAHYKSIVAYDGTEYHGFQRQAEGITTVQGQLEAALRQLGWQGKSLLAAGRTDAGVHARGQVISFELAWHHTCGDLTAALNHHLPADVVVSRSEEVEAGFHPRFDAQSRRYRYRVILSETRDPLRERYAWRQWPVPALDAMQGAASQLEGRHDFGAFGPAPIQGGHTVRTVLRAAWSRRGDRLDFEIEADAFLTHMVRRLTAAWLEIGRGQTQPGAVLEYLDQPERRWQGNLAPPRGLFLEAVNYGQQQAQ